MVHIQFRMRSEQVRALKCLAAKQGKSVAELVRISVDSMLRSGGIIDQESLRRKAAAAAGKLHGPENLAENHDDFLAS